MLRLIMQYEEDKQTVVVQTPEPEQSNVRYTNGYRNGSSGYQAQPQQQTVIVKPNGSAINLNFRVFDIDCPELEKVLRKLQNEGSNERQLVLLGIEIVNDPPKPPQPRAATIPLSSPPPPTDLKTIAAETKARLAAKHYANNKTGWRSLLFGKEKPKPLPLPG